MWLTMAEKKVSEVLSHQQTLVAVFSKQPKKTKNKAKATEKAKP